MVYIGEALQNRLIEVAAQHLGAGSEQALHQAARTHFNVPLKQLTYAQVPELLQQFATAEAGALVAARVRTLVVALEQLQTDVDAGFSRRIVAAVQRQVGLAAEPLLQRAAGTIGITLDTLDGTHLLDLAEAVRIECADLLGDDAARAMCQAIMGATRNRPPGLIGQITALAREHLGQEGEGIVRRICRERLEVELDEIDVPGIQMLGQALTAYAPPLVAEGRISTFMAAAKQALTSPAEGLRRNILTIVTAGIGPLAHDFLVDACARHGVPWQAVDYEHLMWLTEVVRAEAAPLTGKKTADAIARDIRALLTGKK